MPSGCISLGRTPRNSRRTHVYALRALYPRLPGSRSLIGNRSGQMIKIVVLGSSLAAISAAHTLLDKPSKTTVQLVMEKAEVGLIGEAPGLFEKWPPCPPHWIGDLGSQQPTEGSTAVRRSWFEKSLGTSLSRRGCTIHLRTRVTSLGDGEINVVGAGPLGSDTIPCDGLLDFREDERGKTEWNGYVCMTIDAPNEQVIGNRPDDTTEVWLEGSRTEGNKHLQEMSWRGHDPRTSLSNDIDFGIQEATSLVDTIIQNPPGQ